MAERKELHSSALKRAQHYAKEKAEKFIDLVSSQLQTTNSDVEISREGFELHLREVVESLPAGQLQGHLKAHIARYAKRLYKKYESCLASTSHPAGLQQIVRYYLMRQRQ